MRLAIVTTHPIQYNAPWFRLLAQQKGIEVKVFYTWEASATAAKYDPGFGKVIAWDIPLLDGYEHTFVKNVSAQQGSHHYKGIDNPTLNKEIAFWGAQAVLVFGWAYKSHLACIRHFKNKIPVIFRGDSTLLDEMGGIKQLARRVLLKYVYSFIDHALYVGQNNKRYFLAHGLKERQLVFAPHAIDNERFAADDFVRENEAKQWKGAIGIPENCFTVLFAGKLEAKKNPGYILKLATKLSDPDFRFIIVGNGEQELILKQAAENDTRIRFIDFQNQQKMPVVYRLGEVFILPSYGPGETWGLAINEAMACGRPVIASTKTGGAIDMVADNGIMIAPDDVDAAVTYIRRLKSDASYYFEQCKAAKSKVSDYSYNKVVEAISGLLRTL